MTSTTVDALRGVSEGTAYKAPCVCVTTANITLSGLQTIAGVTLTEANRVLVKAQTNAVENGIYNAHAGAWTRAVDFDGPRDVLRGTQVMDSNLVQAWTLTTVNPVIGTSALTFAISSAISTSTGAALRLAAQPAKGQVCRLEDYGIETGLNPTTNNAAVLTTVYAAATKGDVFILPSGWGSVANSQLTTFTSRPPALPDECTLRGIGSGPSSAGVVRKYNVSDFREPFMTLGRDGSAFTNFTIYLDDANGFTSGAAIGYRATTSSEFVISNVIDQVEATILTNAGTNYWAIGLCLDNGAGIYNNGGRGIRDTRVTDCKFWGFNYAGMYLVGILGNEITGCTLTRMFGGTLGGSDIVLSGVQDAVDVTRTDVPNNPSYSNYIEGGSFGQVFIERAFNNILQGGFTKADFGVNASSNLVVAPTVFAAAPTAAGAGCIQNVVKCGYRNYSQAATPMANLTF